MKIILTVIRGPERGHGFEDLQNTDGTHVDGKKVEVELREGDILTIGIPVNLEGGEVKELNTSCYICCECQGKAAKNGTDSHTVRDSSCDGCTSREPKKVGIYEIGGGRILEESGRCGMGAVYEKTWHKSADRIEDLEKVVSEATKNQKIKKLSQRDIEDASNAIVLFDCAIKELEDAREFADGVDTFQLDGKITNHRAKKCVREIEIHRNNTKKRDRLLDDAILYLDEAAWSFDSLGDSGAYSSGTCKGDMYLYMAIRSIRDSFGKQSNRKIKDARSEIKSAKHRYESISNELGMDRADQVNKILLCVNNLNCEGFDTCRVYRWAEDVLDLLDEIPEVGLRNVIEILVVNVAVDALDRERRKKIRDKILASLRDYISVITTVFS